MVEQFFFVLLQVAIGNRSTLSAVPSSEEWQSIYDLSKKQALLGIAFKGCENLPDDQRPPLVLFLKWLGMANRVKERNATLNKECCEVTEELEKAGIRSVVLKGQSNRWNYGKELCDYRSPGDIDLWTWSDEGGVGRIVEYTKQHRLAHGLPVMPWHRILYYHVESQTAQGTEIELHYRPSYLNCFWRNRRLQKWFTEQKTLSFPLKGGGQTVGDAITFPIPSHSFNAVYQLLHIYKHLFEEGIGLRQILDYYFVLRTLPASLKGRCLDTLASFGMKKFTGATMYVLQTAFAMPKEYLLCEPNEKEGKFLLDEIMMAGNFGKHDERIAHGGGKTKHAWEKLKHNFRLIGHYPEEVLWEPVFRGYHWIWRRFEFWKFE